jgi:hypothetical protein
LTVRSSSRPSLCVVMTTEIVAARFVAPVDGECDDFSAKGKCMEFYSCATSTMLMAAAC